MSCQTADPRAVSETKQTYSLAECSVLLERCRVLPAPQGDYRVRDFVENLLLTVLDFQMNTTAVVRAMRHFTTKAEQDVPDLAGLQSLFFQYADDKAGNTDLALRLWGFRLWTRAAMLRRLVEFFVSEGVTDQAGLEAWAHRAEFGTHFAGRVKGLGFAVFHWLVIRQGVESIKPDVHVLRFVADAVGRPVGPGDAVEMLVQVARALGKPVHQLDWSIWEAGRGGAVG